jgi:hypothetical protein
MSMGTRARLGIVTVLAAALIGLGSPAPAEADLASGDDHDADVETPSVSFTQVAKVPTVTIEPVGPAPADDLPDGTQTSTEIDEDTQVVDAGPVSIDLRDNVDELADGGDPARVDVVVAEAGVAAETGIDGVLLDVQPSQLLTAPVEIAIDYSDYADVYGGDWASRLTLAALPGCDLDTADGCGQVDAMASVNDTDAQASPRPSVRTPWASWP